MTTTTHAPELNSGIWTSWLPVTTAYPSQSGCQSAAWARVGIQPSPGFWPYIYDPAYDASVANSLTCLPPVATSWWNGGTTIDGSITSYSLGPVTCPVAYETVSTTLVSGAGGESTSVICCPSDFTFVRSLTNNGGIDGVCTSIMSSGQAFTYASPASNSYVSATTKLTSPLPLIAVPVEGYNFAAVTTSSSSSSSSTSTNLPVSTATSPTSSPTSSPISSSTTTSSGAPPTNTSAGSGGLSSGAKTGIGVGVGVSGLAVVLLAAAGFFFQRRRNSAKAANAQPPSELPSGWTYQNEHVDPINHIPYEMSGTSKVAELPARYM